MTRTIAAFLIVTCLAVSTADAEVVRIDVYSRTEVAGGKPFGLAGSYERIIGTVLYEVSNRGTKGMLRYFNHAAGSLDPLAEEEMGGVDVVGQGAGLTWKQTYM